MSAERLRVMNGRNITQMDKETMRRPISNCDYDIL